MAIRIPEERAYYRARSDSEELLCWLPADELRRMIDTGKAPEDVLENYPDGLEVRVAQWYLDDLGIDLGFDPEGLTTAFSFFLGRDRIDESGLVAGRALEAALTRARGSSHAGSLAEALEETSSTGGRLQKPSMSAGTDPETVMQSF